MVSGKKFSRLDPGYRFYKGEDSLGGLKIARPYQTSEGIKIPDHCAVALALTELCCFERGRGIVYVFSQRCSSSTFVSRSAAYTAFSRLADLLYVPYVWTERERDEWQQVKPQDRLHRLNARHGWIREHTPVLPIALEYQENTYTMTRIDGYTDAPTSLLILPQPYVGDTDAIRRVLRPFRRAPSSRHPETEANLPRPMYLGETSALDQFRVGGGVHIIIELEQRSQRHDLLSTYAEQRAKLITAGSIAAEAGHTYGIHGIADIANFTAVVTEEAQEDVGEARDDTGPDFIGGGFSPEL